MKRIILVTLLAVLPLCISAQSLVGTWEFAAQGTDSYSVVSKLVFNEDGTFIRDYITEAVNIDGKTVNGTYHEEGRWKLTARGKRVMMKVKPSSVNVDAGDGVASGVGKVVEILSKVDAVRTVNVPRILSLTEDELVMLETYEDSDDIHRVEKVRYVRKKD